MMIAVQSFIQSRIQSHIYCTISKGYHYVINLCIASNFYVSIDPVYPESLNAL